MRSFQEKSKWRKVLESKPALFFLGLILLVFAYSVISFWVKMSVASKNRDLAEQKVAALRVQKEDLAASVEKLKTNEGVEASIREKFGLVKDGEGVIVVVEEKNKEEEEKKETGGFFSFFKNLFKK